MKLLLHAQGDKATISCGPFDFITGFVDPRNYAKGLTFNLKAGQRVRIPTHALAAYERGQEGVIEQRP